MSGWTAVALGAAVLVLAGIREAVRWRGRRWQRPGSRHIPEGDDPRP